jgi:hypothetical protein
MALSLAAVVSFKPETSTPANLLSFAEQEATRQLRRLSAAPHPGPALGDAPLAGGIDMPTTFTNHVYGTTISG